MNTDNIRDEVRNELILVIKDTNKDFSQFLNALQVATYSVLVVGNEQDSMAFAQSTKPSCIVLDILMSESNGWEICRQLKTNPKTIQVPLVLINSCLNTADRVIALDWKNVDCVAQGSKPKKIVDLIQTHAANQGKKSSEKSSSEVSSLKQDAITHKYQLKAENQHSLNTNRDLEKFTSLVSQDLQTSLSSLTTFTDLLANEYQNELDETAQNYLQSINSSSSRMKAWVEDLRNYSQAGKSEQTWRMVDLNQVMEQVTKNLQSAIAKTKAEIVVGDLPQILLNPQEISQILENLVDNALKFTSKKPHIEISATRQNQAWLISVADNGMGIPIQSQSEIFQVFQRLHVADAYPGAGIGLAICAKIIDRYGGRIWVESQENQGSTFYFTLPLDVCLQKTAIQSPYMKTN